MNSLGSHTKHFHSSISMISSKLGSSLFTVSMHVLQKRASQSPCSCSQRCRWVRVGSHKTIHSTNKYDTLHRVEIQQPWTHHQTNKQTKKYAGKMIHTLKSLPHATLSAVLPHHAHPSGDLSARIKHVSQTRTLMPARTRALSLVSSAWHTVHVNLCGPLAVVSAGPAPSPSTADDGPAEGSSVAARGRLGAFGSRDFCLRLACTFKSSFLLYLLGGARSQ